MGDLSMGKLALAAKITHVPSMYLSELPGKNHGCRQSAIDGHKEISKRCRELGVDTIIVFDTHWLVNSAYHINCADHFSGIYTSNELPHFIRDMTYDYDGNPALGQLIADEAVKLGVRAKAHNIPSLKLEYGTLVPMRYMNSDKHFKVISIAGSAPSTTSPTAAGWARPSSARFRNMTAPWRCSPAVRCRTVLSTTSAPKRE